MSIPVHEPQDHFSKWVAEARSTDRLLVVLDPERYLDLESKLRGEGRTWRVYHYAENDLAFRAAYNSGPVDPNLRHIVWITPSPFRRARPDELDLSFMADVLRRADRILDLSLTGLLKALLPGEVFPDTGLEAYGSVLSKNLPALLAGHQELRLRIDRRRPLDIHHVRALALHCLQPDIPIPEFLFAETNTSDILRHYLKLVWSGRVANQTLALLQEHAAKSPVIPVEGLRPWFQAPPDQLALLVYTYRALGSYGVPNPLNQLRGLGLLTVDPTPLEPHLDSALAVWEDEELRAEILRRGEAALSPEGLTDLVQLFPLPDISTVAYALRRETAPALAYGLAERFLSLALREDAVDEIRIDELPSSGRLVTVETHYTDRAQAAMAIIREIAFILDHLRYPFEPAPDLAKLADWYIGSRVYRLELARALAEQHVKQVISPDLRRRLQTYLDQLLGRIWDYLDKVDDNLMHLVAEDYESFLHHPRLSTHVLRDTILESGFRPTLEHCVWILIFDGMRWDSWKDVVLPALMKHLEVVDEGKAYLSLLPSTTSVARTGLLAGSAPPGWRAANGRHTSNERILAARLLDLDPAERDRWLRIEVASETDTVQRRLGGDFDRKPINIMIYGISDDWIHNFKGNLAAVNAIIAQQMQTVVDDLQRHVREGDLVVVTSDHGFVELDPDKSILVNDRDLRDQGIEGPAKEHVFYRSLVNLEHPDGLRVPFHGDDFYTVAQGRTWFQREGGRFSRYSHGGISMSEMVVPGLVMERIVEPFVKLSLSPLPRRLTVLEKEPQTVSVTLHNSGNRATEYEVAFATNTEPEKQAFRGTLGPREAMELSYTFTPAYSPRPTDRLTLQVIYSDADGHRKAMPTRSIGVTTEPRRDVVEIDFGGLDQLDEL
jgi:hypothetical protein